MNGVFDWNMKENVMKRIIVNIALFLTILMISGILICCGCSRSGQSSGSEFITSGEGGDSSLEMDNGFEPLEIEEEYNVEYDEDGLEEAHN